MKKTMLVMMVVAGAAKFIGKDSGSPSGQKGFAFLGGLVWRVMMFHHLKAASSYTNKRRT
jgi:hypothetical protein